MSLTLSTPRRKKNISMTALIDAVFILLLFFMLTTSFEQETSIVLAEVGSSQVVSEAETHVIILKSSNELLLIPHGTYIDDAIRADSFQILKESMSPGPHVVVPNKDVNAQQIVNLLTELKAAEYEQVTLGEVVDLQ